MENKGIARTSRVVDRILKIFQVILMVCFIVCAVFIPLTAIFGEKVVANASTLDLDCLKITFQGDMANYLELDKLKVWIIATLLSVMLAMAAGWYCLRVLREILVPMKEGKPFAAGISVKIRKLAVTVMVGGFLVEAGIRLSNIFVLKAYRIQELLSHPAVKSVEVGGNLSIPEWYIPVGLMLLFLSFVFRSGEKLQREADETL